MAAFPYSWFVDMVCFRFSPTAPLGTVLSVATWERMAAISPDLPFDQESAERHRQGRLLDWQRPFGPAASISASDPCCHSHRFLQRGRSVCVITRKPMGYPPLHWMAVAIPATKVVREWMGQAMSRVSVIVLPVGAARLDRRSAALGWY